MDHYIHVNFDASSVFCFHQLPIVPFFPLKHFIYINQDKFLGAKAPLGLVTVSLSVTNKKVGNFKILQDLTTK